MGSYMTSHALIGVKFEPNNTEIDIKVRGCNHPESESSFCSECGTQMFIDAVEYSDQFECIYEELLDPIETAFADRFNDNGIVVDAHDGTYFFGYGASVDNFEQERIPFAETSYERIRVILQEILEPYGIWDQCRESYGFWIVSEGS